MHMWACVCVRVYILYIYSYIYESLYPVYIADHQAVMMHKERAVKFWMERNHLDRMAALEMWDSQLAASKHRDEQGPTGGRVRIAGKIEDFIVSEDSEIFEKEKLLEHKRAKFGEEQDLLMDEALEGGRAASATDLARFGISDLASASTNLVGSIFGNRKRLALATAPANPMPSGESGQDGKEPKPKAKAFDAGLERLALQDKLLTSLDKEVNGLLGIIESVSKAIADENFQKTFVDPNTPSHEVQAMKMMADRTKIAEALVGSYKPGQTSIADEVAVKDTEKLHDHLRCLPAELPDIFSHASPVSAVVLQLIEEVAKVTDAAMKKDIETEFKPVVNLVAIMKVSLKSSFDKQNKFASLRSAQVEKQKKAEEQKEVKQIEKEQKKASRSKETDRCSRQAGASRRHFWDQFDQDASQAS